MHVEYIKSITERYERLGYRPYRWYEAEDDGVLAPLKKPLSESRLGMLSTAGAYAAGQVAFYYKDDTSLRRIANDTDPADMRFSHITENYLPDPRRDPNCVFPMTPLARLAEEGVIGSLAGDHLSCMGGVYSQRRARQEMVPAIEAAFAEQAVEVALLVPL